MKITMENFSENNRERKVGDSCYRIVKRNGKWNIFEIYNDLKGSFGVGYDKFYTKNLEEIIDRINGFKTEKMIIG